MFEHVANGSWGYDYTLVQSTVLLVFLIVFTLGIELGAIWILSENKKYNTKLLLSVVLVSNLVTGLLGFLITKLVM